MKIPLIFKKQTPNTVPWKYIVIHSTQCIIGDKVTTLKKDSKKTVSIEKLKYIYGIQEKHYDLPFHYVIESIKDDYEIFVCQPIHSVCEHYNYLQNNSEMIHIGLVGDFQSVQMAVPRLYDVLAYRIIAPLMFTFRLNQSKIILHSEIDKTHPNCPGDLFFKSILMQRLQKFLARK